MTDKKININSDTSQNTEPDWIFIDENYINSSNSLVTESLQKGFDVAQLPNGDIIVTEIRKVYVRYIWNKQKQKLTKAGLDWSI